MGLPPEIWDLRAIKARAVNVRDLRISPDEGYILSRIEGVMSLRELAAVSGLPEQQVAEIAGRLVAHGAIDGPPGLAPPPPPHVPPPPSVRAPPGSVRVPAASPSGRAPPLPPISTPSTRAPAPSVRAPAASAPPPASPPPAQRPTPPPPSPSPPQAHAGQLGSIEVGLWGATDVGVARKNNEDCFGLYDLTEGADLPNASFIEVGEKGILVTVADGMGGENAGEVASAITVAAMREYVAAGLHEDPSEALAASVVHANGKVIEAAVAPEQSGMGAAVVSVLVRDGLAHVTEVGDCRAYLYRGNTLTQLTKDQTHVQILIDQGLMTPEAAKKSRAKSVVLQAVGKAEELSVTQRSLILRDGDRLLLCSDGLTVNVTNDEIAEKLAGALDGVVDSLITLANARGGVDNVTVVVLEATGALPPSRPGEQVGDTLRTIREFEIGGG